MNYEKLLTKNKAFSIDLNWWKPSISPNADFKFEIFGPECWFNFMIGLFYLFNFQIAWTRKQDHAGFVFDIQIVGLNLFIQLYDTRHWDYENNTWYVYPLPEYNEDGTQKIISPGISLREIG